MANWHSLPFEDCIEPVVYTTKVQRKDFLDDGAYPVVSQEEAFINGFWDEASYLFKVERPLVVFGDHTRTLKYIDFDFVLGADGVKVLKPAPFLHPRFFYYQLHTAKLDSLGYARHYRLLKEHRVSYPAYADQQRIVTILDETFEGIATAKANAEKNLQNAHELLAVATRQAFDALGKHHEFRLLGSVCRFENGDRGKNYPGKEHRVEQGIPFINAGHLTPTGIDFAEMDYISPERFALLGNGKIQPMDVLFCLRGSLGKYASVGDLSCGAIASSLVILRPTMELNHDFLLCFLSSTLCTEQIEAYKGGAAQPNLGAKDLKQFAIPLPPIDTQRLVAESILELQDRTSAFLNLTTKKLAALDELKKSLLHQAFSGQLTASEAGCSPAAVGGTMRV